MRVKRDEKMKRIINWMKENKIISTIIVGVAVELIATAIISGINKVDLIKSTELLWNIIFKFFSTILNFNIPVWIILIVIFLLYILLRIIIKIKENENFHNEWYESYTTDSYKGVLYNWDYYKNFEGQLDLSNFRPICTYCRGNLTTTNNYRNSHYMIPHLYCPNCDKVLETPSREDINQAELFVRNNLKKRLEEKIEKNELRNKK